MAYTVLWGFQPHILFVQLFIFYALKLLLHLGCVCVLSPWNQILVLSLGFPLNPLTSYNFYVFMVLGIEPRTSQVLNILSSIQLHPSAF